MITVEDNPHQKSSEGHKTTQKQVKPEPKLKKPVPAVEK
jgi:hypothetical protein